MAINTCIVSGKILPITTLPQSDIAISAYITYPFFHTDGTEIMDYKVSTTTDATGSWSLTLIETTSVSKTVTVEIDFPTGDVARTKRTYTITVPNTATANFSDLAAGQ